VGGLWRYRRIGPLGARSRHGLVGDRRRGLWLRLAACAGLVVVAGVAAGSNPVGAAEPPPATESYYESSASVVALAAQGTNAGASGASGLTILDFGRPASVGGVDGTLDFSGEPVSFASIQLAVESFIQAYFLAAPPSTDLTVAVGTNNSCGPNSDCGGFDQPSSLYTWGTELAQTVESLNSWVGGERQANGYTDQVQVVAADDAEPGFDPGFNSTYAVLDGYASAVGGDQPAMIDYGSAEAGYWTEQQLYDVAYGLGPDVPVPELYWPGQTAGWAALADWAQQNLGVNMQYFGVLASPDWGTPMDSYQMALANLGTGAQSIRWLSSIS
jgi:hypothetical protein